MGVVNGCKVSIKKLMRVNYREKSVFLPYLIQRAVRYLFFL